MKHIKKLLVFFMAIGLLGSCEEEETSYALQDVSAPTNVKAIFDISQDDTGTVKVTPTAVGATSYEIFFGDKDNETPKVTAPGETVTHVYREGEFTLRIVAIGLTGLTSELSRIVTISFRAPTALTAAVVVTPTNPFEITVTPSATNVTVYDVFFGDVENEVPKTIMAGESTKHIYAAAGEYVVRVVARGAGAATTEITQTVTISGAADPIVLPITFDNISVNYAFVTFNGSSFGVVDNPSLTGANAVASKVGAITNSGAAFEGGAFNLGTPVDFSGTNKTITMKFWSNVAVPILLKFEGGLNAARDNEVVANHGGTGWEVVNFNFTTSAVRSFINGAPDNGAAFVPTGQYATMVIFVDGPGNTAGTFYIDDIAKASTTGTATLPTVGPAVPARAQANVLSIFSDVYADPTGINYFPNWGQTTTYQEIDLNGDKVIRYANVNYQGIDFGGAINVTTYDKFHIDVWSNDYTQIPFFMISAGSGERSVTLNVQPNRWNRIEISLSDFTSQGLSMNDIIQFKLDVQPNNGGTIFLDNLYFFRDAPVTGGTGETVFPVNFESATGGAASLWNVFENVDNPALEIIANPSVTGINTSATVAKFTARVGGQPFAGTETPLLTPFTLSAANSTVKIMVWKSVISDVGIKFANAIGGSTGEIKVANTLINQWEELTFNFAGVIGNPNNTNIKFLVVFPDFNARTQETVSYFDNITLSPSTGGSGGTGPTAPTVAAPTPTLPAANVISMFSNAYTNVPVDTWRTDWSAATLQDITIAGNDTKRYSALDFVGIETTTTNINATSMTHFHTDVWSSDFGSFSIKLVDFGPNGVFGGGDDVEHQIDIATPARGQWVSLDIPLANFTGLTRRANIAQLIYVGTPTGSNTVFIDNVYFHN